ncbi:Tim44-like domain-containing protein [Nitrosomonas sp.]|uniref:Tim44 domain-containing protein n=1 Tax=Nitrosomonas sp. TaxID=42353 RepID=UPI0025D4C2C1|nr:Tim44-like domain-containing protein [Nitrosomonas sp.]MCC6916599.1 Tim44 domain-containing protein [Nitrosomonas sp.]
MRILTFFAIALVAFSLTTLDAEARRLGGGGSFGKQRQSLNLNRQQQAAPKQQPGQTASPASQATPASGAGKWLGPLAGLAAGGLLASLLMGGAFDGINMMDILVLAGIAAAIFFIMRMMRGSAGGRQTQRPMQYSGEGTGGMGGITLPNRDIATPAGGTGSSYSGQSANTDTSDIPADFDVESFVKQAKRSFIALQLAHDAGDLEEIRAYTTLGLFNEISKQVAEHKDTAQQTDVLSVDATLLDVTNQGSHAIASVRFTGEIKDAPNAQPEPFDEIWHVEKDLTSSDSTWLLAGIQQSADMKH